MVLTRVRVISYNVLEESVERGRVVAARPHRGWIAVNPRTVYEVFLGDGP